MECVDHFVVCGEKHLNHIVREFLIHYHEERAHQSRGNVPLTVALANETKSRVVATDLAEANRTRRVA
ncbi:MAG: hypothetical protein U0792_18480 [Gemmataceae bacterium]